MLLSGRVVLQDFFHQYEKWIGFTVSLEKCHVSRQEVIPCNNNLVSGVWCFGFPVGKQGCSIDKKALVFDAFWMATVLGFHTAQCYSKYIAHLNKHINIYIYTYTIIHIQRSYRTNDCSHQGSTHRAPCCQFHVVLGESALVPSQKRWTRKGSISTRQTTCRVKGGGGVGVKNKTHQSYLVGSSWWFQPSWTNISQMFRDKKWHKSFNPPFQSSHVFWNPSRKKSSENQTWMMILEELAGGLAADLRKAVGCQVLWHVSVIPCLIFEMFFCFKDRWWKEIAYVIQFSENVLKHWKIFKNINYLKHA